MTDAETALLLARFQFALTVSFGVIAFAIRWRSNEKGGPKTAL